jgi:hypothetical protein
MDMQVSLKGIAYEGKYEVMAIGDDDSSVSLGMIYLTAGIGNFKRENALLIIDKNEQRLTYQDMCKIKISLKDNSYLLGIIREQKREKAMAAKPDIKPESKSFTEKIDGKEWQYASEPVVDRTMRDGMADIEESFDVAAETVAADNGALFADTPIYKAEPLNDIASPAADVPPTFAQAHRDDVRQILHDLRMTPDKWHQLLQNYNQINPYNDERIYLSLEPKDFVIMSAEYQHLAHNSFLLHGFYNYRHIILGKENDELYLGVPGVYYEREKMVAKMFGFEAFECEGRKAENGKFGYYLKKVKL